MYFEIVIEEEEGGLDKKWTSKDIDENDEEGKKILLFGKYSKLLSKAEEKN